MEKRPTLTMAITRKRNDVGAEPIADKNQRYKMITQTSTQPKQPPAEDEIRDYANHLFVQHGSIHGHDRDDWLEAEACLRASIPKESSRTRMHRHTQITERAALPLVKHGRS